MDKVIFFVDDCQSTCMIFQRMLSELPGVTVMTFRDRDSMWPALEHRKPCLVILDENLGEHVSGESISMEISLKYPEIDTVVISSDSEKVKYLASAGITAYMKPYASLDCHSDASSKCWGNFILRIETRMRYWHNKLEVERIHGKIDSINDKLEKVCEHIEKMNKADVLERVDRFIDEVKKKPLLMFIVSLILILTGVLGFKVGK